MKRFSFKFIVYGSSVILRGWSVRVWGLRLRISGFGFHYTRFISVLGLKGDKHRLRAWNFGFRI